MAVCTYVCTTTCIGQDWNGMMKSKMKNTIKRAAAAANFLSFAIFVAVCNFDTKIAIGANYIWLKCTEKEKKKTKNENEAK